MNTTQVPSSGWFTRWGFQPLFFIFFADPYREDPIWHTICFHFRVGQSHFSPVFLTAVVFGSDSWKSRISQWLHPGRWTWNLQINHLERKMIFQTSMMMFHINLPGCSYFLSSHSSSGHIGHIFFQATRCESTGEFNTVDGSEIRRENQLRLVVYPIIYTLCVRDLSRIGLWVVSTPRAYWGFSGPIGESLSCRWYVPVDAKMWS